MVTLLVDGIMQPTVVWCFTIVIMAISLSEILLEFAKPMERGLVNSHSVVSVVHNEFC